MDFAPQLATNIDVAELPRLCREDRYWFEQKIDGHRVMLSIDAQRVIALNRRGEPYHPAAVARVVRSFSPGAPLVLDGELLGGILWVFDVPVLGSTVSLKTPFAERRERLEQFFALGVPDCVRLLPVARTTEEKAELATRLVNSHAEGVMVKDSTAKYEPGPRKTRCVRKAKFVNTADVIVTSLRRKGRESVGVSVWDGGRRREIGAVTTIHEAASAKIDDVMEVRYLYTSPGDHRLVQPVFMRMRDDKDPHECDMAQLVYPNKEVLT